MTEFGALFNVLMEAFCLYVIYSMLKDRRVFSGKIFMFWPSLLLLIVAAFMFASSAYYFIVRLMS